MKIGKGMKYSACDFKLHAYFTSNGGKFWVMHSLNGKTKEFDNLPLEHFSLIKVGH